MKPDLILCMGNEILSDDSFGFKVANLLNNQKELKGRAEVVFSALGGFKLIDLLKGRQRALIVDTIFTGKTKAGTLHFFEMGQFTPAKNLTCSHQISLPTALSLGEEYGMDMPKRIDVLAVEIQDARTFSEDLTPQVAAALDPAIDRILNWSGIVHNDNSDN
jgi:hydrogenase maturation protease